MMTLPLGTQQHVFQYKTFHIEKTQPLGHGSYGTVYKAKCDELPCASKILHPNIVDINDPGFLKILQRFEQECGFMSGIRHPNIVQYLGVCRDPESGLPVLLMELLDESLTKMLKRSKQHLTFNSQVDILQDISLAIAYLHSNQIVHRDLSSNNVLMIAGTRAKVSDFGMSNMNYSTRNMTPLTMCPGTVAYMPPEALKEPPSYTEKLDCFSLGVLGIQIITRLFPNPGSAVKEVLDERYPLGRVQTIVPEIERRKEHIDLIEPTHPLLTIVKQCLEYDKEERPTARDICQRLLDLKDEVRYKESKEESKDNEQLQAEVAEKMRIQQEQLEQYSREIQQLTKTLSDVQLQLKVKDQKLTRKQNIIKTMEKQLQEQCKMAEENNGAYEEYRQVKHELQGEIGTLKRQLLQVRRNSRSSVSTLSLNEPTSVNTNKLKWREGVQTPCGMERGSAFISGNIAYFATGQVVIWHNSESQIWGIFPACPQSGGCLAIVKENLTTIGGTITGDARPSNKLFSLSNDKTKWVESLPGMPTKRTHCCCVCIENLVIVAGGSTTGQINGTVETVEVLNTETMIWSSAAGLSYLMDSLSATVCGDHIYLLGGNGRNGYTKLVLSCSLSDLKQSCQSRSLSTRLLKAIVRSEHHQVWHRVADVPVHYSTCVSTIDGQLLSFGGRDSHFNSTTAVYKYDVATNTWEIVGHMPKRRYFSLIVALPTNEFMVVGGKVSYFTSCLESVDIASFV